MTTITLDNLTEGAFYFNGPILDICNDESSVDRRVYVRFDHIELYDLDWLGSKLTLHTKGGHCLVLGFDTSDDAEWESGMPLVRLDEQITAAIKEQITPPPKEDA